MDYGTGSQSSAKPKEKGGSLGLAMAIGIVSIIVAVSIAVVFLQADPTAPEARYRVTCSSGGYTVLEIYSNELPAKQLDGSWFVYALGLPPDKPVVVSGATSCVTRPQN